MPNWYEVAKRLRTTVLKSLEPYTVQGSNFKMRYKTKSFLLERFSVIQDQDFDKKTKTSLSANEWKTYMQLLVNFIFAGSTLIKYS